MQPGVDAKVKVAVETLHASKCTDLSGHVPQPLAIVVIPLTGRTVGRSSLTSSPLGTLGLTGGPTSITMTAPCHFSTPERRPGFWPISWRHFIVVIFGEWAPGSKTICYTSF